MWLSVDCGMTSGLSLLNPCVTNPETGYVAGAIARNIGVDHCNFIQ